MSLKEENMKKTVAFVLIAVMLVCLLPIHAFADDSSVRNKRVVSIVYDDSGSMEGDDWAYASYSIQAFAAMLNSDDEMYITYMLDPSVYEKIDLSDQSSAIEKIRVRNEDSGATPSSSLDTAFKALQNSKSTEPGTQYWLVVFTDGGYNDIDDINDVNAKLNDYVSTPMPNGSNAHVYYMTIDDNKYNFTPSANGNDLITVDKSNGKDDIFKNMFGISSEVSGRYQVDKKDIKKVDSKTYTVNSDIPLFNIAVMTQDTPQTVVSIKSNENVEIPIKSSIAIGSPPKTNLGMAGASDEACNLKGNVLLAGEGGKKIPPGEYTITFDGDIDLDDVSIMLEPAIELRLSILQDGQVLDDLDKVPQNATNLSAKAALYEIGTDTEILPALLPGKADYSITHTEDGIELESDSSLELDTLTVTYGDNIVTATANLPGYFNLTTSVQFTPSVTPIDSIDNITAEIAGDGSERHENFFTKEVDGEEVVYVGELDTNKTGVKFTVYENGEPIDRNTALAIKDSFEKGLKTDFNNYEVEVLSDGSYLVYPTKLPFFYNSLIYLLFHHGDQNVSVELNGVRAEETLVFKHGNNWIAALLWIIIPLYIIWWILFKKHFPRGTLKMYYGKPGKRAGDVNYTSNGYIRLGWFGAVKYKNPLFILPRLLLLLLPIPSKVKFGGYTFTGQRSLVRRGNTFLSVKNVKNDAVSKTSPTPTKISNESKTILDRKLYIKSHGSYTKYELTP